MYSLSTLKCRCMTQDAPSTGLSDFVPPHPGSKQMPSWEGGSLPAPPAFHARNWAAMLGPGLVMGAAAIGGGEWLTGPLITARFGGGLFWLATISILGQTIYNVEISRYTLYCGEPIFTGKFRTLPGPLFWVFFYLLLDFGSFMPYLAASASIPVLTIYYGELPDLDSIPWIYKGVNCALFAFLLFPLLVGGKIYNSMKVVMTFKLIFVLSFLTFLAIFFSSPAVWENLIGGFFKFGNVPVVPAEPGGANLDNIFLAMSEGRAFPKIDMTVVGLVMAMAAIAGNGGLTNTPISSYTRDQGWGMGKHVGAIPSVVGGHAVELSHVGMVFPPEGESLPRWRGWVKHVMREQWCVWMPACVVGLALPSMLSMVFLPPNTILKDKNLAAAMTAGGVGDAVGQQFGAHIGSIFWFLTLFCGVLVLGTSCASTADGVLRRWIDVFWTGLPMLRKWEAKHIGLLYFGTLVAYAGIGLLLLIFVDGTQLLLISTMIYNYALGFSCFHVLVINLTLLPKELRPGWFPRIGLALGGVFFTCFAVMSMLATLNEKGFIKWF